MADWGSLRARKPRAETQRIKRVATGAPLRVRDSHPKPAAHVRAYEREGGGTMAAPLFNWSFRPDEGLD
jgi:hypothetical protein